MRTTITLDADIAAAVVRLRRHRSIGVSQAVNELARAGLTIKRPPRPFKQRTARLGLTLDVSNVAEALDLLDEADA
jgi:hypothetical protein